MKHLITIGEFQDVSGASGPSYAALDIDELIRSKALIQGNSGAGKSGLIRVIVEQVNLRVPTLIIDPESEFASLREKLDMILVADNGEIKPDVRSAGLLARKLAELGASAILDLYELKGEGKHLWVRNFLEGLMALPRKLWRPMLRIMDEAQLFAPEKGFGDSDALEAVQDWQFRGRKHGLGSILATPRLAALNKNVSGANNIFIGRTSLDVDVKRAAKLIGKSEKDATVELRELGKRRFFCFGPALNAPGMAIFYVADCETSIPQPGVHKTEKPPPASKVVDEIADKLKDIEQEAEVEIKTLNDAKAEIAKLKREMKQAQSNAQPREQDINRITELTAALEEAKRHTKTENKIVEKKVVIEATVTRLEKALDRGEKLRDSLQEAAAAINEEVSSISSAVAEARAVNAQAIVLTPEFTPSERARQSAALETIKWAGKGVQTGAMTAGFKPPAALVLNGDFKLSRKQQEILNALAWYESIGIPEPTTLQVGAIALIDASGGHFSNVTGPLSSNGLIVRAPGVIALTDLGRQHASVPEQVATLADYHDVLRNRVRKVKSAGGKTIDILNVVISRGGAPVTTEEIGQEAQIDHTGGHFSNMIGPLSTVGLIKRNRGVVEPTDVLFPPGLQ